jgi:hypothetical protein
MALFRRAARAQRAMGLLAHAIWDAGPFASRPRRGILEAGWRKVQVKAWFRWKEAGMYSYDYRFVMRDFEERRRQGEWVRLAEKARASGNASSEGRGPRLGRALAALSPALKVAYWPAAAG